MKTRFVESYVVWSDELDISFETDDDAITAHCKFWLISVRFRGNF